MQVISLKAEYSKVDRIPRIFSSGMALALLFVDDPTNEPITRDDVSGASSSSRMYHCDRGDSGPTGTRAVGDVTYAPTSSGVLWAGKEIRKRRVRR